MESERGRGDVDGSLSVVVVVFAGMPYLRRCLEALSDQGADEVIVCHDDSLVDRERLGHEFPDATFLHSPGKATYAELRAAGFRHARGRVIALTEDQCVPIPEWCARIRAAHEGAYAAVGGPVEKLLPRDGTSDRALNWAQYLCDFSRYMAPVPAGASEYLTDTNVAYKRTALAPIRSLWEEEFHETTVNWALAGRGGELFLAQDITVYQHRELAWGPALAERFAFGRLFASTRAREEGSRRWLFAVGSAVLPAVLTIRVIRNVVSRRRHLGGLIRALPAVVLLASTWALGELVGYATGSAGGELKPHAAG